MLSYKKLYAFLVGSIDDNLSKMDQLQPSDLHIVCEIKSNLQNALLLAEEYVISDGSTDLSAKPSHTGE